MHEHLSALLWPWRTACMRRVLDLPAYPPCAHSAHDATGARCWCRSTKQRGMQRCLSLWTSDQALWAAAEAPPASLPSPVAPAWCTAWPDVTSGANLRNRTKVTGGEGRVDHCKTGAGAALARRRGVATGDHGGLAGWDRRASRCVRLTDKLGPPRAGARLRGVHASSRHAGQIKLAADGGLQRERGNKNKRKECIRPPVQGWPR